MTSAGGARVLPHYGPVSAAKAALESNIRQLAAELAPQGITANSIRAGVTATPAAQKIPNYEEFSQQAARRNPHRRLTTTDDVARAIVVLSHPDTYWITGNVIGVDGGEEIVGLGLRARLGGRRHPGCDRWRHRISAYFLDRSSAPGGEFRPGAAAVGPFQH